VVTGAGDTPLKGKWIKPFTVTKEMLVEYEGRYYSEELDVNYDLAVDKDKLYVKGRNLTDDPLKKLPEDYFSVAGGRGKIQFQRNGQGTITGFKVSTGRVLNLHFEKVK
jgi:hypothetical protein